MVCSINVYKVIISILCVVVSVVLFLYLTNSSNDCNYQPRSNMVAPDVPTPILPEPIDEGESNVFVIDPITVPKNYIITTDSNSDTTTDHLSDESTTAY